MALSTRTKFISGFVSLASFKSTEGQRECMEKMASWCGAECENYALIMHDLDTKLNEDGEVVRKTEHFHFVCVLNSAVRISTFIHRVADACGVPSLAVTADKCSSIESSVQYLIHKNDADKHQYQESDIVRAWDDGDWRVLMESEPNQVSFDYFYRVCSQATSICDVIKAVGISKYHAYRNTIQDIYKSVNGR